MATLALMVSIIFIMVLFSGPVVFFLAKINRIPSAIIYTIGIITIFFGLWFCSLPIPAIRYAGLFSALLAGLAMMERKQKKIEG